MKFSIGQILSVGTGRLCCDIGGVYEILNYLTEDSLFTHQLPRGFRACQPWVTDQCPWLKEVDVAGCTPETVFPWVATLGANYGREHELQPLPKGIWQSKDPLIELTELIGPDKIVVVQP